MTFGALLVCHGAQKLFGWFGGPGFGGTARLLGSLGFRRSRPWAALAGLSELGGGLLTALGFLHPLGQLGILAAMGMATAKVHAGKPIWVTAGGAELPMTNMAIATSLMLGGPGRFSLDEALDVHLPRWIILPGLAAVAAGVAIGVKVSASSRGLLPEGDVAGKQPARPD